MRESAADKNINIHEVLGAFNEIKDPRRSPATRHIFHEMLFMSLAAVIAGAEGCVDIELFAKELVAVDGKSMRRSHDKSSGKKMVHTVSAWASENRLVLGQITTEEKK